MENNEIVEEREPRDRPIVEHDTRGTHPNAICPYCGYEVDDSCELSDGAVLECSNEDCEQVFEVTFEVVVYYTTRKYVRR